MGEHHWQGNRRYAKADVYAVPDLIQDHRLSFVVTSLLRMLCELCNYRDLIYVGTISELHDLTRLSRKTITSYLDELCNKKLITRLPTPVGSRQTLFDVSTAYSKLIVPNEETPRAAKKAAKSNSWKPTALLAPSPRQMTPDQGKHDFGGREVRGARKARQRSQQPKPSTAEWSSHSGQLFKQITQQYSFAQHRLEQELRKLGLDPDDDWCEVSFSNGLDHQVVAAFMSVVDEFRTLNDFIGGPVREFRGVRPAWVCDHGVTKVGSPLLSWRDADPILWGSFPAVSVSAWAFLTHGSGEDTSVALSVGKPTWLQWKGSSLA